MALTDDAKAYYEHSDDISTYVTAAELYLANAGIAKDETNDLYCLAVKMMATHWSDNRGVTGSTDELTFGIKCIITQLQNVTVT